MRSKISSGISSPSAIEQAPLESLTTTDLLFLLADPDGPGKALWDFVSDVVCEDFCQPNDLSVVLQEQKSILVQAFSVLQALYRSQEQWCSKSDTSKT